MDLNNKQYSNINSYYKDNMNEVKRDESINLLPLDIKT